MCIILPYFNNNNNNKQAFGVQAAIPTGAIPTTAIPTEIFARQTLFWRIMPVSVNTEVGKWVWNLKFKT